MGMYLVYHSWISFSQWHCKPTRQKRLITLSNLLTNSTHLRRPTLFSFLWNRPAVPSFPLSAHLPDTFKRYILSERRRVSLIPLTQGTQDRMVVLHTESPCNLSYIRNSTNNPPKCLHVYVFNNNVDVQRTYQSDFLLWLYTNISPIDRIRVDRKAFIYHLNE